MNYQALLGYKGVDLEIWYHADYGVDYRDGDFDVEILEIYLDVNRNKRNGPNLFASYHDTDIDAMAKMITEEPSFYEQAHEETLDYGDYLRDKRRDDELTGDYP